MNTDLPVVEMPSGVRQAIEVADRLGVSFSGVLARTAIYRCICACQHALVSAGTPPTSNMVELLARTVIEQRLNANRRLAMPAGQTEMLLAEAS